MMVEVGNNRDFRFLLKQRNEFKFSLNWSGSIDIWNALKCWYEQVTCIIQQAKKINWT